MSARVVFSHHYHSPEDVRDYLQGAALLLDELELPDDLRAPAFTAAVGLLSAKHEQLEVVHPGSGVTLGLPH